jgi:ABC-2 type transport system ATP-binding protein
MIARGLVHEPKLLILDEPTAGVDVEMRRGMWDFLEELNRQGRTIILTTHYLEEAEQLCNQIAIIAKGKIVENTGKRELLRKFDKETFLLDTKNRVTAVVPLDNAEFFLVDDTTIEVTKNRSLSMNRLLEHLDRQGIVVDSMRNKANRLEELFMEMVE